MSLDFYEAIAEGDNPEPSDSHFTFKVGAKRVTYISSDVEEADDITEAITTIIGNTSLTIGNLNLARSLPAAHPQYPWLFADDVSIKGVGFTAGDLNEQDADEFLEADPIADQWLLYDLYQFTVSFTARPYAVLDDDSISIDTGSWFDFGGASHSFSYANEWTRFTDFTIEPQNDYVTGQQGQMWFVTSSSTRSNTNPYHVSYTASPRMRLPNLVHKYIWYGVPLRYITSPNSYIQAALGTINQNAWNGYPPGSLLFASYAPTIYTPNIPSVVDTPTGTTSFSTEKLCDIVFSFLYTNREGTNLPGGPSTGNANFILGGWNLLPWLNTRLYYYAESSGQVGGTPKGTPSFYSYPHERIWSDPDSSS